MISGTRSGDDANLGASVKAAEIEREAVLLEALEGCKRGSAVKGPRGKAGFEILWSHDGVIAPS
jgi:hypothetical protein